MIWIAPSEKDTDSAALENRLWDAADQFRANSGLKSQEYFLGEFTMSEDQGGGEFYTLSSIVRLLTEVIEPYHGRKARQNVGGGLARAAAMKGRRITRQFPARYKGRRVRARGELCN